MEYVKVLITRDPMEKIPVIVPAHEVPILEDVHGQEAVSELKITPKEAKLLEKQDAELRERIERDRQTKAEDEGTDYEPMTDRELVGAEHVRLEMKYGMHPELKMSHVEHVYGRVTTGALQAALGLGNKSKPQKPAKTPLQPAA